MTAKEMTHLTANAERWLASFEQLSREEQLIVAKEVQRRLGGTPAESDNLDMSPPTDEEMIYMASQLFGMYDEEERQHGCA